MQRILILIGGITVALIAIGVTAFVLFMPEGRRLDETSRDYASHVLDTAMKHWDMDAIKAESSTELLASVPDATLTKLLRTFAMRLGSIQSHGTPRGEARVNFFPFVTTADYLVPTTFEKASGQVAMRLILKGREWKLMAVNVNSDALLFPPSQEPIASK